METTTVPWEARAELSVLSICRNQMAQGKCPLPLSELEAIWSDYGVRYADLPAALARLSQRRVIDWKNDGAALELTASGERWFADLPGAIEYQLVVMRRRQTEARRQSGFGSRSQFRRRRVDQEAVAAQA